MEYIWLFNNIYIVLKRVREGGYFNGEFGVLYSVLFKVIELVIDKIVF